MTIADSAMALRRIDRILSHVQARSPAGAFSVGGRLREVINLVERHPRVGRTTDRPRQRRIVVTPYPYVIFSRVDGRDVTIPCVGHTSRRPS